jgi:hypothetical protein
MSEAVDYTVCELLGDGCAIEIRALRREDEADMLAAVGKTSAQSLQRRFFVMKRHFSDKELAFFLDVDFNNQSSPSQRNGAAKSSSAAAATSSSSRGGPRWHSS